AKLDEIAERQRKREHELEERERLRKEAILRGTPIDAPPKPTFELPGFAAPAAVAPAAAAASTGGKYVPRFKRSGPAETAAPPPAAQSDKWSSGKPDDRGVAPATVKVVVLLTLSWFVTQVILATASTGGKYVPRFKRSGPAEPAAPPPAAQSDKWSSGKPDDRGVAPAGDKWRPSFGGGSGASTGGAKSWTSSKFSRFNYRAVHCSSSNKDMVGRISFVDGWLAMFHYTMFSDPLSLLWVFKALLSLRVYYSGTMIGCWIMVGKIDPYLGGAPPRGACSHGGSHALLTCLAKDLLKQFLPDMFNYRAVHCSSSNKDMVGQISFVDGWLTMFHYTMFSDLLSLLWVFKALLSLRVYYSGTVIGCWIMVGKIDPYLGGAPPRGACSHVALYDLAWLSIWYSTVIEIHITGVSGKLLLNVTYARVSSMPLISSLPLFKGCGAVHRCVTMSILGGQGVVAFVCLLFWDYDRLRDLGGAAPRNSFQGLTPKSPSSWHRSLAPSPNLLSPVNPSTRRTTDQAAGGKLRDKNTEESWALLEDLALYDNESWNDPRDFAKPVKAISLPQDVLSTSDRCLIKLENQVQRLMAAHLAPKPPVQVNKVTSSCEICSGPHDTQYCMENPEQAFVDYVSSRIDEAGGKWYTFKPEQNNLGDTYNPSWKIHLNLRLSKFEPDFKQQSEMTNKIDPVLNAINDRITRALPSDTVKNRKLNVKSTSLSARSYPKEDPQCSSRIHESGEKGEEEKGDPGNINTDPPSPPDPSTLLIMKKCDDSFEEELEEDGSAVVGELEIEYSDTFPTRSELTYHKETAAWQLFG
ncbi:hypothetical protein Tco_0428860, partial [Tanacetum coccineum]